MTLALRLPPTPPAAAPTGEALGLSHEDMEKPKIAVVNSSSELAICYAHLDGIAKMVKEEIRAAGGMPFEVRTAAPSDFITGAAKRGSYILAGRDIIANDIEVQVEAALLDGMICLTSCDKTPPGHLMAAARAQHPDDPRHRRLPAGRRRSTASRSTSRTCGAARSASASAPRPSSRSRTWPRTRSWAPASAPAWPPPTPCTRWSRRSACAFPATPRCAPTAPKMQANARAAARRIVEMVHEDLKPRQILTEGAFRNAIATVLAVSGSINAIKHLQATAIEAENGLDIFQMWEEMADVPVLSAVRPTGEVRIEQFEDAGGAQAVLKRLEDRIDTGALTCTGKTLGENLAGYVIPGPDVIHPIDDPVGPGPAIAILHGQLRRHGGGPPRHPRRLAARGVHRPGAGVRGLARLPAGRSRTALVKPGDVVVARNQGLKGGPAMGGSASLVLFALNAAGLAKTTAFVTDGQLSGLCLKGLTVAEVAPEAAIGGPIGKVRDGDTITIRRRQPLDRHRRSRPRNWPRAKASAT